MKYLIATSDTTYFHWQLLVQYNNFKKLGIEKDLIWVYSFNGDHPSKEMRSLILGCGVKSYGFKDNRQSKSYASSIRPYILAELFRQRPDLKNEVIFYTDPDVLFSSKFSTAGLLNNDTWYLSDTKSYLNTKYIKSKGEKLFDEMCSIVGINPTIVEANDDSAGGAQYIMKGLDKDYWEKVYWDCENLYTHMIGTKHKYSPQHPIQAWTSDMWAVLWNAWLSGHKTKIINRMDFSWATDPIKNVEERSIYHNAGVFDQKNLFNKGHFASRHPFNENFDYVTNENGSHFYIQEILDSVKNYSHVIEKLK